MKVDNKVKVSYVDRMNVEDLRKQYPELKNKLLVDVNIIDNGETLEHIQDTTQNFVIANHFIEHCQNPILTIKNMLRVLESKGIIFLAVPDKRFTFDKNRKSTSIDHLLKDYNEGAHVSKTQHFYEWSKYICNIDDELELKSKANELIDMDYSIHFHVWEKKDMDEFLSYLNTKMNFGFEIQASIRIENSHENIYVLKKF